MSQVTYDPIALSAPSSAITLARSGGGLVTVVLSAAPVGFNGRTPTPLAVGTEVTFRSNLSAGGTDFNGSFTITALTDQQHWQYQQPSALGADTASGGTFFVSPAQYTFVPDSTLVDGAAFSSDVAAALQHNGLFAIVRKEMRDMGFFTDGSAIPPLISRCDGRMYSPLECRYLCLLGSSRQPAPLEFTPGAWQFPVLNNSDAGSGNLLETPQELHVSLVASTKTPYAFVPQLTAKFKFGGGIAGQGTVRVICVGQRFLGGLAIPSGYAVKNDANYATPPALPWSGLTGLNVLNQTKARQLARDLCYGMVRCEFIDMGYYGPGDTVAAPVSPEDGYVYTIGNPSEVLFLYELGSTLPATGYTPGQLAFPSLGADLGSGNMLEAPMQLTVNGATGQITSNLFFAGSGVAAQGTVRVLAACQRSSAQAQA